MAFPLLALLFGAGGAAGTAGAGAGAGAAGAGAAGAAGAGAGAAGAGAAGAAGAGAGAGIGTLGGISPAAAAGLGVGTAGATAAPAAMGAGSGVSGLGGVMSLMAGAGGKGAANNPKAAGLLQQMISSAQAPALPPVMAAPSQPRFGMAAVQDLMGRGDQEGAVMAAASTPGAVMSNQVKMEKLLQSVGGPQGLMAMAGRTRSVAQPAPSLPMPMPPQYSQNPFEVRQQSGSGLRLKDFGMRFRRGGM